VVRRLSPEQEQAQGGEALTELTAGERLPILLVDDRPENLRTLEAVLAPLGFPLQSATSGEEALRLLLERDFALILLDVRMPGLDGLETARLIKGRARTGDIPIVFLTAARDEVGDIIRGYGVGAVDYVLKPFDAELLRSKVAVFAELENGRRSLKRSEALLRGAFEAAPIGKTVLDGSRKIVRANPAFAHLLDRELAELPGVEVAELCHEDDRQPLSAALDRVAKSDPDEAAGDSGEAAGDDSEVDLRLKSSSGSDRWVAVVASSIEPTEFVEPLLLVQWVDLSSRRRAEQARAELLIEQSARSNAEATAERLNKLQALADATESLSLNELLSELAMRLAELFDAELAEVRIDDGPLEEPVTVRAAGGRVLSVDAQRTPRPADQWQEVPLSIEQSRVGVVRLALAPGRSFSAADQSLLHDAADRAALSIRRMQLHEEEHRIAIELQRGLIPKRMPLVAGLELAAHYEAAGGAGSEVGGDWYDAFALPGGRLGVVLGDVAGKGIPAASMMGQLRSVTRAFALADDGSRSPGDALTRLNRHQLALGEDELFTVIYAIIDPRESGVAWASAGHLPPLLLSRNGESSFLEGADGLMGIDEVSYHDYHEPINGHSTLILYTDGLVERRGESLDAGLERLAQAAVSGPKQPQMLCDHVLEHVLPPERQRRDDVTTVVVKIG
jgi:PAS domain S-box-containing protein